MSRQFERVKQSTEYEKYPNFYVIALVNFNFRIPENIPVFHDCSCYSSIVIQNSCLSYKSQIHVLEIPKLEKLHKEVFTENNVKNYSQLDYWMKFFSDKTTYEEIKVMAAQSMIIDSAKSKIDHFVLNDENIKAYSLAEEAEKIRKAEIDFARKNSQEQTAIDMIKDKKPLDEIIKYSRLSPERIAEIKATLQ